MDRLFSPWRAEHVAKAAESDENDEFSSIFEAIGQSSEDRANFVVWRGLSVYVVLNLFPYTNGHMMVVPYRRVADYDALTAEEVVEMSITVQYCIRWLRATVNPDGFNVGLNLGKAAGAGITGHLHMHVVPRWSGDTNFTSTVGDYRVIPESLEATYNRIVEAAANDPVEVQDGDVR